MSKLKTTAALTLLSLLAACGGGGGGITPSADTTTIDGSAIKGPLAGAEISFYKTTAGGQQGDLLAKTLSNAQGAYTQAINGYNGVVIVVASVLPGTTMYDEATGQTVIPPAGQLSG